MYVVRYNGDNSMFHTVLLQNIPQGEYYQRFRLLLLQSVQDITAGHWNVDNERHDIVMILDKSVTHFVEYINRQLKIYRETLHQPEGELITAKVLD